MEVQRAEATASHVVVRAAHLDEPTVSALSEVTPDALLDVAFVGSSSWTEGAISRRPAW